MPYSPFDIPHLVLPTRLSIRAVLALVSFLVLTGQPKPTLVEGKYSNAARSQQGMEVRVSANMFRKTVNEHNSGPGGVWCGLVCPGIKLCGVGPGKPGFGVSLGRHAFYIFLKGWEE